MTYTRFVVENQSVKLPKAETFEGFMEINFLNLFFNFYIHVFYNGLIYFISNFGLYRI